MDTTTKAIDKSPERSIVLTKKMQTAEGWKRAKLKQTNKPLTKIVSGPKIIANPTHANKPIKAVIKTQAAAKQVSTKPKGMAKPKAADKTNPANPLKNT